MADKKTPKQTSDPIPELMQMATAVRAKANGMSDEQREASFRHGMQLIYGGSNHGVAAKTSRP